MQVLFLFYNFFYQISTSDITHTSEAKAVFLQQKCFIIYHLLCLLIPYFRSSSSKDHKRVCILQVLVRLEVTLGFGH